MKIVRILAVVLLAWVAATAANAAIIESVSVNVLDRGSTSKVLLERMSGQVCRLLLNSCCLIRIQKK